MDALTTAFEEALKTWTRSPSFLQAVADCQAGYPARKVAAPKAPTPPRKPKATPTAPALPLIAHKLTAVATVKPDGKVSVSVAKHPLVGKLPVADGHAQCDACGSVKPASDFYVTGPGKLMARCKACISEIGRLRQRTQVTPRKQAARRAVKGLSR